MTGGIGFSRQGKDSFRQNHDMLNKRMGRENNALPSAHGKPRKSHYDETKAWKEQKERRAQKIKWGLLVAMLFIAILILFLLN